MYLNGFWECYACVKSHPWCLRSYFLWDECGNWTSFNTSFSALPEEVHVGWNEYGSSWDLCFLPFSPVFLAIRSRVHCLFPYIMMNEDWEFPFSYLHFLFSISDLFVRKRRVQLRRQCNLFSHQNLFSFPFYTDLSKQIFGSGLKQAVPHAK